MSLLDVSSQLNTKETAVSQHAGYWNEQFLKEKITDD